MFIVRGGKYVQAPAERHVINGNQSELIHAGPLDLGQVCGRVTINISLLRSSMNLAKVGSVGGLPPKMSELQGTPKAKAFN